MWYTQSSDWLAVYVVLVFILRVPDCSLCDDPSTDEGLTSCMLQTSGEQVDAL